ncbi:hypothetical protein [Dokdonella sp.]|uniref:hypothetical protein n=1 Tax=Dokdonella sp. TaxID=2291710 RepID=UPI003C5F0466
MKEQNLIEEMSITELEQRVEFSCCGGGGGGGSGGDGGGGPGDDGGDSNPIP